MEHTQPFIDDDGWLTQFATRKTAYNNNNGNTQGFLGIVHEASIFSCPSSLADITPRVSTSCEHHCPSCLSAILPNCIENVDESFIGKGDFNSEFYVNQTNDVSGNDYHFNLIDDQTLYDPIYVDNQGIYFDGTTHIRTTTPWIQNEQYSFTYEGWIRPLTDTLAGDLFEFEIAQGERDARIGFNGNNIEIDFQDEIITIPITYAAADVGEWTYVGVSVRKYDDADDSEICIVFGDSTETCADIPAYIQLDAAGNTFQVGAGFNGMIHNFNLLDWPKRDYEFYNEVQNAGCTPWNGVACDLCPSATGECISICEVDEYGDT